MDIESLKSRLADKSTKAENGCHLWIGATRGNGYGAIKVDGRVMDAHRAAYIVHKGRIPDGKLVMHTCDHRSCVNPEHLKLGTHRENNVDAIKKGLSKPFRPTRYEPLSDREKKQIKAEYESGVSVKAISRKYDIAITSASRLLGRTK